MSDDDVVALAEPQTALYKRRWYVLLVYSTVAAFQGYLYNMFGPIFPSMQMAYGWSRSDMASLPLCGNVLLFLLSLPSVWLLERVGLRTVILLMASLSCAGCAVRAAAALTTAGSWTLAAAIVGSVLVGIAGAVTLLVPPFLSARWFAPGERRLSTAVGETLNAFGVSLSFAIGPALVSEPSPGVSAAEVIRQYRLYTYGETAIAVAMLLAILVYFPDAPPLPPSPSAADERVLIVQSCRRLLTSANFWAVCLVLLLTNGASFAVSAVLDVELSLKDIDQKTAGWIGFYATLVASVVSIVAARIADRVGHLKAFIVALSTLTALSSVWLLLLMLDYIPFSLRQVYVAVSLWTSATYTALPIGFELAAEIFYPLDEAAVVGLIGVVVVTAPIAYQAVLTIPTFDTACTYWLLAVAGVLSVPASLLIRDRYNRSQIDANPSSTDVAVDD